MLDTKDTAEMVDQVVMVVEDNNGVLSTCPLIMINWLTQVGAQDAR